MKFFLILALLVSSLTGCDYLPTSENKAKKIVSEALLDPESARFRSISAGVKDDEFCGYVSGKNRMGGYTGASPFIVNSKTGEAELGGEPLKKSDFQLLALMAANNNDLMAYVKEKMELAQRCNFPKRWKSACKEIYPNSVEMLMVEDLCFAVVVDPHDGNRTIRNVMRKAFP